MTTDPVRHRDDLDPLLQELMKTGKRNLKRFGELMPVGLGRAKEGPLHLVAADGEDTVRDERTQDAGALWFGKGPSSRSIPGGRDGL